MPGARIYSLRLSWDLTDGFILVPPAAMQGISFPESRASPESGNLPAPKRVHDARKGASFEQTGRAGYRRDSL